MNDKGYSRDRDPALLIDRLAADELDDGARRALFAWLDSEPARWRRCALALLEAREMAGALEDWLGERASIATPPDASKSDNAQNLAKRERRPGRNAMLVLAASVALAFGLGMAADRRLAAWRGEVKPQALASAAPAEGGEPLDAGDSAPRDSQPRLDADDGDKTQGGEQAPQVAVTAAKHLASGDNELLPAYVKSQLERRGYRVDSRRQFVSIVLPDGRRALAPVEQWKFKYVGNRAL